MLRSTLLPAFLCLSSTISALAIPDVPTLSPRAALTISLPSSDLPAPSTISPAVSLKYIALGVGTQNYTCASTPNSASGVPVSVGAKATLSDAGSFLQKHPEMVSSLPGLALGLKTMTGQDISNYLGLPGLGNHFFNAAGSPTFDLTAVSARLVAKKLNDVVAPADACPGPNNVGAVDWLELQDNGTGQSFGGISYAYRVETAGGKAPATCKDQNGAFTVPYASEYWFYG